MTLYEFNALNEAEQTKAVWDSVHVAERRDAEHNILLYQRDSFYIEIFHQREYNAITRIRAFVSTDQLQPYISLIDISELI